jgi:acetyl esterase/lipase
VYTATGTPNNPDPVYDPTHDLHARIFIPTTPRPASGLRPAIIYLHGGGFAAQNPDLGDVTHLIGSANGQPSYCCWLGQAIFYQITRGWVVVSVDYRPDIDYNANPAVPANPFPAALQDVKTAVNWVKTLPGIDRNDVVVAGSSAGGTLATMVALTPGQFEPAGAAGPTTVRAAVNLDGPSDLQNLYDPSYPGLVADLSPSDQLYGVFGSQESYSDLVPLYLGCAFTDANCINQNIEKASPVQWVNPNSPPIYFACGTVPVGTSPGTSPVSSPNYLPPNMGCPDAQAITNKITKVTNNQYGAALDQTKGSHADIDQTLNFTELNRFLDMPGTSVLVPSASGTSMSGQKVVLDASATANDADAAGNAVTKVEFRLTGGIFNASLVATATLSLWGWWTYWDTTTVPNGNYTLQSVAYDKDGNVGASNGIQVVVNN